MCEVCGKNKEETDSPQSIEDSADDSFPSFSPTRTTFQRQKSMSVESRRRRDENCAKEQWNRITKYCKNVSVKQMLVKRPAALGPSNFETQLNSIRRIDKSQETFKFDSCYVSYSNINMPLSPLSATR